MGRFHIAGCFADNIIVDRDSESIRKECGGPAHFMQKALEDLGEEYTVAEGKKAITEIHIRGGEEAGRLAQSCRLNLAPISAKVVLVSAIAGEVSVERLRGEFEQIHLNTEGFVRDLQNFGEKRKWEVDNVDKIRVVLTAQNEMDYLPQNLISHIKRNGILIVCRPGGRISLVEKGEETQFECGEHPCRVGLRDACLAAFSSAYLKAPEDAKAAMNATIEYSKRFLANASQ